MPRKTTPEDVEAWASRAAPPALEPGEVHLWAVSLEVEPDVRSRLVEFLTADERARAERLIAAAARARFVAAHGALRLLLGTYARVDPGGLSFAVARGGKPFLGRPDLEWLRFNLAHSEALALVAVSAGLEVGVDVEHRRVVRDAEGVAERYFAPDEARTIAGLPAEARSDAFLRCWTCKEAVLKLTGDGFARRLDSVRLTVRPDEPPRLLEVAGLPAAHRWSLHGLAPASGYVGALAVPSTAVRFRCFTLRVDDLLAARPH